MTSRLHRRARSGALAAALGVGLLWAALLPVGQGEESARTVKIAELVQLQGLAKLMQQSKAAGQEEATRLARSIMAATFAKIPAMPQDKRAAVESASREFLHEVDAGLDQDAAVQAWGRFYADGLTDKELDAILAYYRSAVGQKDVRASQAALPQLEKYLTETRAAAINSAVVKFTAAVRDITSPSMEGSTQGQVLPLRHAGSNPSAPDGKFVADSVSDRCEVPPAAAPRAQGVPPSGRSVLCVCVDEKGKLLQDPVITESSGDSKVDLGAVKLARTDSGRYQPPVVEGQPQRACFQFSINFRGQE